MPWPQHYVLVGPRKERPSYNQLKPTQWVAGVLRAAIDLPTDQKDKKIEYLANLMEDALDFSFENAKVCHVVVLTTMEADKLTWLDTDRLDRYRRSHAQRPVTSNKDQNFDGMSDNSTTSMVCKYYLTHSCKSHGSHHTKGIFYKHNCQICGENHKNKSCIQKSKN